MRIYFLTKTKIDWFSIYATLDFFKNTTPGESIESIVITGGSSRIPQLKEALGERFAVPVEFLNPFNRLQIGKAITPEMLEELSASVSIAVGLACRRLGDSR